MAMGFLTTAKQHREQAALLRKSQNPEARMGLPNHFGSGNRFKSNLQHVGPDNL
jgi:hypothetical protein